MSEWLESMWNPYEFHHSIWNPCGIHVERWWNLFHGSIWNPDGNSIWNDGIHMESISFQVDSIWNEITKMAEISAKTYSIWNEWNPSGMTWIPYGFHMECGGLVKTSHIDMTYWADLSLLNQLPFVTEILWKSKSLSQCYHFKKRNSSCLLF